MQLIITGKNMNVSSRTEDFVRRKMERLDRHLTEPVEARVELSSENTKDVNQRQIVQVTLTNNGTTIRAQERAADLKVAVDMVVDKLNKQIRRYKGKQVRKRRVNAAQTAPVAVLEEDESEWEGQIVRRKRFKTPPMSPEEAIDQMELLGHSFFIFQNQDDEALNVVYRRTDGNYGVLEPLME